MIEIFKTDVQNVNRSKLLVRKLTDHIPGSYVNFDLEDCDNILRVEGESFSAETIITFLKNFGHSCDILY